MGSATMFHLARRGLKVLGIEALGVPNDRGSSHGESRIIRKVYFEHPAYVPLLHRAYDLWRELEAVTGQELFRRTGLLEIGDPNGAVIRGVKRSAAEHRLAIEVVPVGDVPVRFPGFAAEANLQAVYEADAGFLHVERCVQAHASQAEAKGAEIAVGRSVRKWSANGSGVTLETENDRYSAGALAVCAGPWTNDLLQSLGLPLTVRRKVVLWLQAKGREYALERGCPVFCFDTADGFFYGCPTLTGTELKMAEHSGGERIEHADRLDRALRSQDTVRVMRFADRHFPGLTSTITRHSVCMYTMTPDEHFVIDRHPHHPNVVFAGGFSGHGFKFAPVVGEALADLVTAGKTELPIGFLSGSRFQ